MSSENRNYFVLASLAAAGAGFAASLSNGWFNGIFGYNHHNSNDGKIAHKSSFKEILAEHEKRKTVVSRYATLEVCNEYKEKVTFFGFTLKDALKAGLYQSEEVSNNMGILAGDGDVYTLFPKVLSPLIEYVHGSVHFKAKCDSRIDERDFEYCTLDPRYVLSCRMRALRSLRGFPFAWLCSENERQEIEGIAEEVLGKIEGSLVYFLDSLVLLALSALPMNYVTKSISSIPKGYPASTYLKLSELDTKTRDVFLKKHYIFNSYINKTDETWPSGRGIWYGNQGTIVVLVNEQEHLKFITQQTGSDVRSAFHKLRHVVDVTQRLLCDNAHEFLFDDDYGHLTSSPREIGTGFRVSMNVRLPRLSQEPRLAFILHVLSLKKRQRGIITKNGNGVMELSNATRSGYREVNFINHVVCSIRHLIAMETLLEDGHVIDPVLCEIIRDKNILKK